MKKECYVTTVINQKNNPETNQCLNKRTLIPDGDITNKIISSLAI